MAVAARRRPEDGIHVVQTGETISSIAASYGITEWRQRVYDAPQNAQLKLARPNPNTLVPGDEIFIPELQDKMEARPTDAWHDFHVTQNKRFLRLKLQNADDTPIANEPYRIEPKNSFRGRFVQQGQTTSAEGVIEEEIPHTLLEADVILTEQNLTVRVHVGALLPLPTDQPVEASGDLAGNLLAEATGALDDVTGGIAAAASGAGGFSLDSDGASFDAAGDLSANALGKAGAAASAAAGAMAGLLGDAALGEEVDPNIHAAGQRLHSMGFRPGETEDNRRTAAFTAALMAFQTWCKQQGQLANDAGGPLGSMTAPGGVLGGGGGPLGDIAAGVAGPILGAVGLTGQLDEQTIEALKTTHGC